MSAMDVSWILFVLAALQPVVRQKSLESTRCRMIASIEKQRRTMQLFPREQSSVEYVPGRRLRNPPAASEARLPGPGAPLLPGR